MSRRLDHEEAEHPHGADDDEGDEGPEGLHQDQRHRLRRPPRLDEELDDQLDALPQHEDDQQNDELEGEEPQEMTSTVGCKRSIRI